ncbi:MAG TPA: endonuclease III [Urbifossiella sp.]|nr:endonuclease III [Urbifossiella sp.]
MTDPSPKLPPPRERATAVLALLADLYPAPETTLVHADALQLLVATILSAQCTDKRVNLVTPPLFARYCTAADFADADPAELEEYVKTTGFFRTKAKNIRACCRLLVDRHGGEVPGTLEELVALPGVGRKTANVVLGDAFDTPGITVDTHVGRLSRRLGWTRHADSVKVERVLMKLWLREKWTVASHQLILHGRAVCGARKPRCGECALSALCPKVGVLE